MDKYEYKIRSEEIKSLIAQGEYAEAASIADSIDWRRVKSVMMLCTISDLYKINRRLEDAKEMLLLAYDRHPGGRSIVYSLCELSIKMGEFVEALGYYKEFVQVAPKDSGRYVLKYKLFEAQEVTLEERIEVLEELKSKDYSEKWAYELAYLYHRVGLATKCVEECDELILWFGDGKYVRKALELKQLHEPLTSEQQEKYNRIKTGAEMPVQSMDQESPQGEEPDLLDAPTREIPQKELDIQVKVMNVGQYDTINMQRELAENMKEIWENGGEQPESQIQPDENSVGNEPETSDTGMFDLPDAEDEEIEEGEPEERDAEETVEAGEILVEEVFFGETGEIHSTEPHVLEETKRETQEEMPADTEDKEESTDGSDEGSVEELLEESVEEPVEEAAEGSEDISKETADDTKSPIINFYAGKPSKFDNMLGMEYDGQLSMVVPDSEQVEKQITGQLQLEDVLLEWEKMKKDNEQKRMEAVRQHVLEQTGAMFTEFDAAARDGLLEQLEKSGVDEDAAEEVSGKLEVIEGEDVSEEADTILDESVDAEIEEDLEEVAESSDEAEDEEAEETDEGSEEAVMPEETAESGEAVESEEADDTAKPEESDGDQSTDEASEDTAEDTETAAKKDDKVKEKQSAKNNEGEGDNGSKVRELSAEEQQIFSAYTQNRKTKEQIVYAIDHISMAAYTGNVIITGEEGADTLTLAKNLIKEIQQTDSNFSGKIAKISGSSLNQKDLGPILDRLKNGALIVQSGGDINEETVGRLRNALEQENSGVIILLEDTKKAINKLLRANTGLTECFNIRIDIEALDNDSLVEYGKKYAREQEYSIDDFGMLALHTRIAEQQTSDHAVTISEVKELVDNAIAHANRKSLNHFIDILVAKRYDNEDMIILREKDFM
ncbi:MAG: hypothetical protein J1E65_07095 [Lachnospiraceae bacterium]|nr:hypothetical protein [Lachnospiraceae bacterium]